MGLGSLAKKWGFGVEFSFDAKSALSTMRNVRQGLGTVGEGMGKLSQGAGTLGAIAAPFAASLGIAAGYGSSLASELEGQALTMRILLGSSEKAADLMGRIREFAEATPFEEGDLIKGSKNLLRLSGDNLDVNQDLLKTMATMAALEPGKTVDDAVQALLDATSGGGFERFKEFGISLRAEDFKSAGTAGGKQWADAVSAEVKKRILARTRGEDLLAALAGTTGGAISNAKDQINGVLRELGEEINQRMKPFLQNFAANIKEIRPLVKQAVADLFTDLDRAWTTYGKPVADAIGAWWAGLSTGAKAAGVKAALWFGLLTSVAVVLGGALAGGLTVLGAFGTVLAGLGTIATGVFTVLSSLGLPAILGIVAAVAALTAGLAVAAGGAGFAAWAGGDEALLGLQGASRALSDTLSDLWFNLEQGVGGAWKGFSDALFPAAKVLADYLQPAIVELVGAFQLLFTEIGGSDAAMNDARTTGEKLGYMLGTVVLGAVGLLTPALKGMAFELTLFITGMKEAIAFSRSFGNALNGIRDGSLTLPDVIELMTLRIGHAVISMFQVLAREMYESLTTQLATVAGILRSFGATGLADRIDGARAGLVQKGKGLDQHLTERLEQIDWRADEIERKKVEDHKNTLAAYLAPKEDITFEARLLLDGKEVAKSQGTTAEKNGQAGKGKRVPPESRGRVLRNGLEITPLRAAEVL